MNESGDTGPWRETQGLELLARLLVGLACVGSDELLSRLRTLGPAVAADVEMMATRCLMARPCPSW